MQPHADVVLSYVDAFCVADIVHLNTRNVNRHIIAGLANSLGGITPPYQRFSEERKAVTQDFLWANG